MIYYDGKPVLKLKFRPALCDKSALSNIWCEYNDSAFLLYNKQSILDKFNSLKTKLQPNSILWFAKSCKFPRYKLQDSGFTRCIKPNKANFTIWSPIQNLIHDSLNRTVLEDETAIYLLNTTDYFSEDTPKSEKLAFKEDPVQYIKDNGLFYGSEIKVIYSGRISQCNQNVCEDLTKLMNGEIKNIVMADDLDKEISQKLESLTLEDIESINDMLGSSDSSTVDLGLKMLTAYNVLEFPGTIRFLLGTKYKRVERAPSWKSVAVQQMLKTVNYTGYIEVPNRTYNLQIESCTEKDKEFLKPILAKEVKRFMERLLDVYNIKNLEPLGVKVNYEVE